MTPPSEPSTSEGERTVRPIIVLDACVLLNLFATSRIEGILRSLDSRFLVSQLVRQEALWFLVPTNGVSGRLERHDISFEPILATGLLELVDLTPPEQEMFVEFAQSLGDGESAAGAIAIGRSAAVATDDARARQEFSRRNPPVPVLGTPELLRLWEARSAASRAEVATTLQAIQLGARYRPRGNDDNAIWWRDHLRKRAR